MINSIKSLSQDAPPADFWVGIEQFNQGDYYACHDTLEAIWMDASTGDRGFYQGIIQISVGLYHLTHLNWQGAAILLGEGSHRLNAYSDLYGGINVTDLVNQAIDWLTALQETGPDQVQQLRDALVHRPPETELHGLNNSDKLRTPKIQAA